MATTAMFREEKGGGAEPRGHRDRSAASIQGVKEKMVLLYQKGLRGRSAYLPQMPGGNEVVSQVAVGDRH